MQMEKPQVHLFENCLTATHAAIQDTFPDIFSEKVEETL